MKSIEKHKLLLRTTKLVANFDLNYWKILLYTIVTYYKKNALSDKGVIYMFHKNVIDNTLRPKIS